MRLFALCTFFLLYWNVTISGQHNSNWILDAYTMLSFSDKTTLPRPIKIRIDDPNIWVNESSYSTFSDTSGKFDLCFDGFDLRNAMFSYDRAVYNGMRHPHFSFSGDGSSFQSGFIISTNIAETEFFLINSQSIDRLTPVLNGSKHFSRFVKDGTDYKVLLADSLLSKELSEAMTIIEKGCGELVLLSRSLQRDEFVMYFINSKGVHSSKTIPSPSIPYLTSGPFFEEFVTSRHSNYVTFTNFHGECLIYKYNNTFDTLELIADLSNYGNAIVSEISEDEETLFLIESNEIDRSGYKRTFYSYDLTATSEEKLEQSKKIIAIDTSRYSSSSDLRRGPDGKIYVSNPQERYVGAIYKNTDDSFIYDQKHVKLHSIFRDYRSCNLGTNSYKIRIYPKQLFNTKSLDVCTFPQTIQSDVQADYYHWSNDESTSSIQVDSAGIYWLDAIVDGCTITDSITVRLSNTGMSELAPTYMLCTDSTLELTITDPKAHNILWSTGQQGNSISLNMQGSYGVNYQVDDCKIGSDFEIIESSNAIQIDSDQELCEGQSITLSVVGLEDSQQFLWSTGENQDQIEVSQAGQYSVVTTNADGCQRTDHMEVSTIPKTVIHPLRDTTICDSSSLTFQIDGTPWYWNDTLLAPSYTITTSQRVHAYNPSTCTTTDTILVNTEDCSQTTDCRLFLPNAVSASVADVVDHSYTAFTNCPLEQYTMYVFDRWGNQVYRSHTIDNGFEVEDYPLGVYVAKFEYRFSGDTRDRLKYGTFTVF